MKIVKICDNSFIVTIISYTIITLLFISELNTYLTPDIIEELFVDTTREPKLQINLNITVPAISCKCKLFIYFLFHILPINMQQECNINRAINKRYNKL